MLLFLLSGTLLSVRAHFGYFFNDEPFIVSLAQRFLWGADLIVDEWNTTQNFGVLLLPLYKAYVTLTGSTEGILLTFRILYAFMWAGVCTLVYGIIRQKYSGGFVVFCYLILFSPLDQMTLSYTSVSLSCCLLIAGLFLYHLEVKPLGLLPFTAAYTVLSVIAVISLPYMALVYVLTAAGIAVVHLVRRTEATKLLFRANLISCILAAAMAVAYLYGFVLDTNSLSAVLENLGYIFHADYNESTSFFYNTLRFGWWILKNYHYAVALTGVTVLLSFHPGIRENPGRKYGLFLVNALVYFLRIGQLVLTCHQPKFNFQMMPIVFLGVAAFFLLENQKKYLPLFGSFVVYGALYALMFFQASDTVGAAVSMGMSVCGVAGIVFIAELGKQFGRYADDLDAGGASRGKVRLIACTVALVFFAQISLQVLLKEERHYWDVPVRNMRSTVSVGAGKGIWTSQHQKEPYETRNESLQNLKKYVDPQKKQDVRFLSMISAPVLYLDADFPVGAFSTWTFLEDDLLLKRLNMYYSVNPDMVPNVVFQLTEDTRTRELCIDLSEYRTFTDGQYSILIAPEFVSTESVPRT